MKSIRVKTINEESFKKRERFHKHSGSHKIFEFVVVRHIIDAKLIS